MAIRLIRKKGDEILGKQCKEVKEFDKKLATLLDDMYETMIKNDGAGLAGPQVGILKRVVVIDTGEGRIDLVNPVITKTSGSQIGPEGCLSVPGVWGEVERPSEVTVRAKDKTGKEFELTGKDMLARAICHEVDHLDGKLFLDKVIKFIE
jgi:peptide deformylase